MRVKTFVPHDAVRYEIELDRDESYTLLFYLAEGRKKSNTIAELCGKLERLRGDFQIGEPS